MYTDHFGLKMLPFENVPDPVFFFDKGEYGRVRDRIADSIKAGRGLIVVPGPIGSGKTTLSQIIISEFSKELRLIWIAEPPSKSLDLFLFIAMELGLKPDNHERTFLIKDIRDALMNIISEGTRCLLIIDESHLMSHEIINDIRVLNNLEVGATKLLQILLLGQEELMGTIKKPEMEPFKQRIATLERLGKMNSEKIREYVSHRIAVAGGKDSIFSETGWEALMKAFGSQNIPRIINTLCDRSLNVCFERGKEAVDIDDVYKAAETVGLEKEVFFYKISHLKNKSEKTISPSEENDKTKDPETLNNIPSHSISMESEETKMAEPYGRQSKNLQTAPEGSVLSLPRTIKELKTEILFLFLSIWSVILSFFFYCQRSGSADPMTCFWELIKF